MHFSVVVPTHNAAPYVVAALRSVAGQTLPPQEVLVIDDDSMDDTVAKVKSCGVEVRLSQVRFRNAAATRNHGIEQATGKWIAFLDADDVWHANHLERVAHLIQVGELSRGGGDVGVLNAFDAMSPHTGEIQPRGHMPIPLPEPQVGLTHHAYVALYADAPAFVGMTACTILRDRLHEVGGLDVYQKRRHDIELWLRVIRNHTWAWDPVPSSAYRYRTPGSVSSNFAAREYDHLQAWLKNHEGYTGQAYDRVVRQLARRALATAMTDGTADDRSRALDLAMPHLAVRDRLIFYAASLWPAGFARLNRLRRPEGRVATSKV